MRHVFTSWYVPNDWALEWAQDVVGLLSDGADHTGYDYQHRWFRRPIHQELIYLLDYQTYVLYLTLNGGSDDIGAEFAGFNYVGFEDEEHLETACLLFPRHCFPTRPHYINAEGPM
ncbi:hypothetical protein AB5N19_06953 [Seiridium cardinale]